MQDYVSRLLDYRGRQEARSISKIILARHRGCLSKLARLNNLLADHNKTIADIRS